ncbi:MAG: cation transporter [Ignavibacteria bacterium RBG_13_36_8]|nr:MAG: cation transporter [Ignavibacteria bacterium RBG_13_36_8]
MLFNAIFLLISSAISFFNNDTAFFPLLYSALIATLFGCFPLIFVPPIEDISNNEGMVIVVSSWLLSCLIGMLPYLLWGGEFTITNAWFESVSGYTTTGSSILTDVESLPMGLLFWRASTHWIGGIGIIIFVLSVLPSMGIAGMILVRSEMSPTALRQFKMRAREAVRILVAVYLGITISEIVSLLLCGLNLFDSITHTFATVATGGFSTKNSSIAAFQNPAAEIVIMFFMIISGMNFALLFAVIIGNFSPLKISTVVKYYLGINFIAIVLVSLNTYQHNYNSYIDALRYSSFQILSIGTSTGFANADSSVWPGFSQIIIIFFTLQCACAGSTSGGIKIDRMVLMFKSFLRRLKQVMYPNAVISISIDGSRVNDPTIEGGLLYILFYLIIVVTGSLLLAAMNVDALSALSGTAAAMGNVGPGLSSVGSLSNYSQIPIMGKWILSTAMLLGRLEIYGLIIYFMPKTWR